MVDSEGNVLGLDLGCGKHARSKWPGFFGVDAKPGPTTDGYRQMDLLDASAWTWRPNSIPRIICLHVIEHFLRPDGLAILGRAYRALAPGGWMIVAVPDMLGLCRAYVEGDTAYLNYRHDGGRHNLVWPGATPADQVNWAIHQESHLWGYDLTSLTALAAEACGPSCSSWPAPPDCKYCTRGRYEVAIEIVKRA